MTETTPHQSFRQARDLLLDSRADLDGARRRYVPPRPATFNWALDWFDQVARSEPTAGRVALRVVDEQDETALTYAELSERSDRLANWYRAQGMRRGDRLLLMLGNQVELWETMLACIKLGVVIVPATTQLSAADIVDRIRRGGIGHVVARAADAERLDAAAGECTRIAAGGAPTGWLDHRDGLEHHGGFEPDAPTFADDTLLLYFTSGTTTLPKLVEHSHVSYPIGHLSTMYWVGLQPGDVHVNVSSPGWAKHAWSTVFAPWNAEATVLVISQPRFDAEGLLETMAAHEVTTFCAPPTVWRMLVQADLAAFRGRIPLREVVAAGEPLNPEVIEQVRQVWDVTVRDGYGQTETCAQIANTPGQPVRPGSMGRPLPGYEVVLREPASGADRTSPGGEGEVCLRLDPRPVGLMTQYRDDPERTADVTRGGEYHTGDVATIDEDGYITFVGRTDDVFKSSDYRISPFELESVLIEHPAVTEAAVVPSPDPIRLSVPKAYVTLAAGHEPDAQTAGSILHYAREHLAPYKRVRRLEFGELPKTISGKIRRVELRDREDDLHGDGTRGEQAGGAEFWEDDVAGLGS
ncbi:acetyl-CoA synthetase [Haloactinopolyspora alba]|uniref:Acetyl-CoA synthetase n=1 Tax=Haloactinopolyspora alba TaxID=648780 RepID=A0A2P8E420_9ACTN|nr:AMP-binding protein [Haloactinopolyspora alba]PSL04200.1 acetyl-CoA synthetase [Haloactinopolyspora alba]